MPILVIKTKRADGYVEYEDIIFTTVNISNRNY